MVKPLTTVIINTFKEKPLYLTQAINGYLNQVMAPVQLILSTVEGDPSLVWVKKKYGKKVEFCVSTKKEHPGKGIAGIYYQLNKATKQIRGKWFCYASGNDVPVATKLKDEISLCQKTGKLVCYSNYTVTNHKLKFIKKQKFPAYSYARHLKGNFISDCSLIRTDILKRFLPFSLKYYNCGFYYLWLLIGGQLGNVFVHNPKSAFLYRQTPESTHKNRTAASKKKYVLHRATLRKAMTRRYAHRLK